MTNISYNLLQKERNLQKKKDFSDVLPVFVSHAQPDKLLTPVALLHNPFMHVTVPARHSDS